MLKIVSINDILSLPLISILHSLVSRPNIQARNYYDGSNDSCFAEDTKSIEKMEQYLES